jgi:[ribosomal protein S5]-alanine N-acetyltransferase
MSVLDAGGAVALRPPREEDVDRIVTLADDRAVADNLLDSFPHPYTLRDAYAFLDRLAMRAGPPTHFAITLEGAFVGMAGFEPLADVHRLGASVGYWLGRPYWGRGIATAAVRALSAHAFAAHAFERLQASVFAWNAASARVLEKAGYTLEARLRHSIVKDGRIADGLLYARLRA